MFGKTITAALLALHALAGIASAQDAKGMRGSSSFYIGAGTQRDEGIDRSDDTPFVLGFMHQPANSRLIWGADIAREGTMLDSTYGRTRAIENGTSYNLLVGRNFVDRGSFRLDAAVILGLRETVTSCHASYLGYRCYADRSPDTEYRGNFGVMTAVSYDALMIGMRITEESAQTLVGIRF
ncbi:hypothetical protein Q4511_07890 [Paracoccus sp. 1_MG-2023]|uniref:hypothetical protein n=1 Tax=unclassified Paracoccus (in: a-proteobacteria) TaxID=2688777 RepID=UPI001C08B851|nr:MULTISPECIES: hypothetical protein [unclassified Paracoccus (in: a-proteobacteria)]MBU2957964.1 hypothetical protein [Paracoccus sp. C2R09]MDO6668842.1 hypothetical protein [Paracoccus sp. 1_MG-2023]